MVRILRAVPQFVQVPVVLMSGVQETAGIFADRLLRKPFEPAALLEELSGLEENTGARSLGAISATRLAAPRSDSDAHAPHMATQCAAHIRRGLQLISEQETRLDALRRRHINTDLARQSYDALVGCVIALASLETAAMASDVLPGLPPLPSRARLSAST